MNTTANRPRVAQTDVRSVTLDCLGGVLDLLDDEIGQLARDLLDNSTPEHRAAIGRQLAREITDAEARAASEDRVLENALDLRPDDHSVHAEAIRETAASIRDHRAMAAERGKWRRRDAEARQDFPKPQVTTLDNGDVEITLAGNTVATLTAAAASLADDLLRDGGLRQRVMTGRHLQPTA